jgi:hypothetical protein
MSGDPDRLTEWAVRLAQHATPDEVDLAPAMTAAFVRGGRDRRDLFRRSAAHDPGGIGGDFFLPHYPFVLQTLHQVAGWLPALLSSAVLGNFLAGSELLLAFRSRRTTAEAEAPESPELRAVARLSAELVAAGIDPAEAPEVACRVLEALLTDPAGGAEFVERIGRDPR